MPTWPPGCRRSAPGPDRGGRFRRAAVLAAVGVLFLLFRAARRAVPYWSLYLDARGLAPAQIGTVLAVPLVTKILAPNLWSWLADVSGWRLGIIRLGVALALLCFTAIFFVDSLAGLALVLVGYSFSGMRCWLSTR